MAHVEYLKIWPLILIVSSCTFGEGPELVLSESELLEGSNDNEFLMNETPAITAPVQLQNLDSGSPDANSTSVQQEGQTGNAISSDLTDDGTQIQSADNQSDSLTIPDTIVRIPRTDFSNAPKIDGDIIEYIPGTELLDGEWRFAAQSNSAGEPIGINNYMFGNPDQVLPDSHSHWAALHDGEYLYLLLISDDDGKHFQDTNEIRKPWKDDSVELFFDGNNSQLSDYDGVDDFHITVNLFSSQGVPNDSSGLNPMISQSARSAPIPSDLSYKTGPGKGPQAVGSDRARKDIYEVRIKLSELNIQIDKPFGFEVQLNDDDDGGSRDTKWAWRHPHGEDSSNDYTWQNPGFMGTAILQR